MMTPLSPRFCFWLAGAISVSCWLPLASISPAAAQTVPASELSPQDWEIVRAAERQRLEAIRLVEGSVVAIYDFGRQGGGSGVVIDPSGIVVTNHHVIMGAGVKGVAGLSDGQLYEWDLIGTDPGGDVAIIQLKGKDRFPSSRLADSETVCVGDWALAMGNPFVLTEDQAPTITLGIVSGVKRFQEGAGQNQLVYGNCIQVDSSINPGNSGGPLFNLSGRVIGINGRGSFLDRGRVNVGLGYAISSNQIKNFLPDLLATKLVEHGTLDANFSDQGGRVICSTINEVSPVAEAGLELGDELLEFEGEAIRSANQYMNLVCTLPADWPARLKVRKSDDSLKEVVVRLLGLPYAKPGQPPPKKENPKPEERQQQELQQAMFDLLAAEPGTIRMPEVNRHYVAHYLAKMRAWFDSRGKGKGADSAVLLVDDVLRNGEQVGRCTSRLDPSGAVRVTWQPGDGEVEELVFDGQRFAANRGGVWAELTATEAKQSPLLLQAMALTSIRSDAPFARFGAISLDGGDKALGRPALRFKCLDADEDWFYFWVNLYDQRSDEAEYLAQVSADKDCDGKGRGVTFADWQPQADWMVARKRTIVRGLNQVPELELQLISAEPLAERSVDWANIDTLLEAKR
ncbi:MAG: S1C family serine protease [Planctomycetota bacterium]|jgi:serine protease Do